MPFQAAPPRVSYTWDNGNRLHQIQDAAGSTTNTITRNYDGLDRLSQETITQAGAPTSAVSYTYDAANRRATMTVTGQSPINYGWDNANHLRSITQISPTGSTVVTIGVDAAGRPGPIILPNHIVATPIYDAASEITQITYQKGSTTVGTLTYGYDSAGRTTTRGGSLFTSVLPAATASAVYDANNRLTSWGSASLGYDPNGNLSSDGTNSYSWDARNRLTSIVGIATYGYDGLDRRQTVIGTSGTISTVYDVVNQVQESSGGTVHANSITGAAMDARFTRTIGLSQSTYLADILGSTVALTNAAGTLTTSYAYDPYGSSTTSGTPSDNPYQFTGSPNDGTGLYYYRNRFYNPLWGRFISEDKLGISASPNLYAYANGDPTLNKDPLGLWTVQLGISGSYTIPLLGGWSGVYFAGIAFDGQGNVGGYYGGGTGAGVGGGASGGGTAQFSNAPNICDLSGPFGAGSRGGGWGDDVTGDFFFGSGGIVGGGVTIGAGLGTTSFSGVTGTVIVPF